MLMKDKPAIDLPVAIILKPARGKKRNRGFEEPLLL